MNQKSAPATSDHRLEWLTYRLGQLWHDPVDRTRMEPLIAALDLRYGLGAKLAREALVRDILEQMAGRIAAAYRRLSALEGQRILDLACGSSTSRAPASLYVDTLLGEREAQLAPGDYTALFEPWFCRILLELGAQPVGVDFGDLSGEAFEHYRADLAQPGALDFLPGRSFDAVQDSRLFGSPEFTAQLPDPAARRSVAAEIWRQEQRLLKPGGLVVHSDAKELIAW